MNGQLRGTLNGITLLLSFVVGHIVTGYFVASSGQTSPEGLDILFTFVFSAIAFGVAYAFQYASR